MRAFFKSRGFKILTGLFSVLLILSITFSIIGKYMSPESGILGSILVPIQKAASVISEETKNFFTVFTRVDKLEDENNELRRILQEQTEKLEDYDKCKSENEYLYEFLELKRNNPDYELQPSDIISFDTTSYFGAFTINKGSTDGISAHDPVVTSVYLSDEDSEKNESLIGYCVIGYIGEVSATFSTVTTILDPALSIGATDTRTRESGIISGSPDLIKKKLCKMSYLTGSSAVTVGDTIVTSGTGGVFPSGLMLGTVTSIASEQTDISLYASIKPSVDFSSLEHIMVITAFDGQGGLGK